MTAFEALDDKLRALGFQGSHVLRLMIGRVKITAGVSLGSFSLGFVEAGPRSMTQYEISVPPNEATKEMIGNVIRLNLIQNHSASVEEWDALQYNLEKSRQEPISRPSCATDAGSDLSQPRGADLGASKVSAMLTEHEMNLSNQQPTVLIVDNEPVITDTLALILAHHGYRCSKAYNGWAGLARAREVKPDMVMSGVINGDGPNGIDMAIQILAEMPETKILLFSGQAASVDLLEVAEGHDLDLVAKPVIPSALLHWCELGGVHDLHSCVWCRQQRASSRGAYPHGVPGDCACPWCRALAAG